MAFAIIVASILGMGMLTVVHVTHRRLCLARGIQPQPWPLLLYAVLSVMLFAVLAMSAHGQ